MKKKRERKRLTGGTKRVAAGKLPHASEQLREAADTHRHAEDDVGVRDAPHARVVPREDERGRCEGEQAAASCVRA